MSNREPESDESDESDESSGWTLAGFQVNLFADDVVPGAAFYAALGFRESYRYPAAGEPLHVEVRRAGLTIGISSVRAAHDEHGLQVSQEGGSTAIVLWCDDAEAAYAQALAAGATAMREPRDYQDGRLREAWVRDPLGNPLELVQERRH